MRLLASDLDGVLDGGDDWLADGSWLPIKDRHAMSDTVISAQLVRPREEVFTDPEALALAGFLSGYSGLTRDACALDLRQFAIWCRELELHLFDSKRVQLEAFARDLEARGRSRATIARRLCTVTCFYRYAEQEGLIEHSPAVHVRRPRLDCESHAVGLDRNELGAILVAAGLAGARDHALIALLAMNVLHVSEATGANIEQLGMERGHRTLTVLRKGGKTVMMPMSPRTARAVDLALARGRTYRALRANCRCRAAGTLAPKARHDAAAATASSALVERPWQSEPWMTFLLFVLVPMAIVAPFALRRWSEVRAGHRRAWTTSERLLVLANSSFNIVLYMPVWPGSTAPDGFIGTAALGGDRLGQAAVAG